MSKFTSITALVALLSALAAAQDTVNLSCTKTHTPTSFTCCGTIAGVTATSYTTCDGCALSTIEGPQCRCLENPITRYDLTSTETACASSMTPYESFETKIRRQDETEQTWTVPATCFTTATYTVNGCGGVCEGTPVVTTKTASVDCSGCGLVGTTATEAGVCVCPTETTVIGCLASPSV